MLLLLLDLIMKSEIKNMKYGDVVNVKIALLYNCIKVNLGLL